MFTAFLLGLAGVATARDPLPDPAEVLAALEGLPPGWSADPVDCYHSDPRSNRHERRSYLVLRAEESGERRWACTEGLPGHPSVVCGEVAPVDCYGLAKLPAGELPGPEGGVRPAVPLPIALPPEVVSRLLTLPFRHLENADALWVIDRYAEEQPWRFGVRSGEVALISPPIPRPGEGTYPAWLADAPAVDLAPVLGVPAWGIPTTYGGEGNGNNASGEYTHTLLVIAQRGNALADVARIPMGRHGFSRGVGEEGFHFSDYFEVQCPVVEKEQLLLYAACESSGDPRNRNRPPREDCNPTCWAGRPPVARYVGHDGTLIPVAKRPAPAPAPRSPTPVPAPILPPR